jgi:hypothetical protein
VGRDLDTESTALLPSPGDLVQQSHRSLASKSLAMSLGQKMDVHATHRWSSILEP